MACPGIAFTVPVVEPTDTIRPYPAAHITGTAARHIRNAVVRLRASAASQSARLSAATSASASHPDATDVMPALLTRMSSRSHRESAASTTAAAEPSTVRSATTPTAAAPNSAARSCTRSVVAPSTTRAPSSMRWRATA